MLINDKTAAPIDLRTMQGRLALSHDLCQSVMMNSEQYSFRFLWFHNSVLFTWVDLSAPRDDNVRQWQLPNLFSTQRDLKMHDVRPATSSPFVLCTLKARLYPKLAVRNSKNWKRRKCLWYIPLVLWRFTYMQSNTLDPACSHTVFSMERGPGKRVGISLRGVKKEDHIRNSSIAQDNVKSIWAGKKLSCSNWCLLLWKSDDFMDAFIRHDH